MHTFKGDKGTIFNYNRDFSGNILIKDVSGNEVSVDNHDIIAFVAYCYVLPNQIEKLEQVISRELLLRTRTKDDEFFNG